MVYAGKSRTQKQPVSIHSMRLELKHRAIRQSVEEVVQQEMRWRQESVLTKSTKHRNMQIINSRSNSELTINQSLKVKRIAWRSTVIKNCSECGADISYAKVVRVKTPEQIIKEIGKC